MLRAVIARLIFAWCAAGTLCGSPAISLADPVQDAKDILHAYQGKFFKLAEARKFDEARALAEATLAQVEREYSGQPVVIAIVHENIGAIDEYLGRYNDAAARYRRALALKEKALGADHANVAETLVFLCGTLGASAQYSEAQALLERALAIQEKQLGPEHRDVAGTLNKLARMYDTRGFQSKVEPLYKRAIAIMEKQNPPTEFHKKSDLGSLANFLESLGSVYHAQGRLAEAEALYVRCYEIRKQVLTPEDLDYFQLSSALDNLARINWSRGRYSEAEPLAKRAVAIAEEAGGPDHRWVTSSLDIQAGIYLDQGRYAEAEPLYLRSLAIYEKWFGSDHPITATGCSNLADLYRQMGRLDEAEKLCRRALAIREKVHGPNDLGVADTLNVLGSILAARNRYDHAELDFQRALAIAERAVGPDAPLVAHLLNNLADLYCATGRFADAEPVADRVLSIRERTMVSPGERSMSYAIRARISWALGRKFEAVADLKRALDLAEEQRQSVSGAEVERAAAFADFTKPFEQMVAWQLELGDLGEALSAMERARARSLLDEMNVEGADLNLGRSASEREQLQAEESKLQAKIAGLEEELAHATEADRPRLEQAVSQARTDLYDHYRDERNSNPVYRNLLSGGAGPPRLSQLQRTVAAPDALVLVYLAGNEASYVLAIDARSARLSKIELTKPLAGALGVEQGPLNADRLAEILVASPERSVVPQLADVSKSLQVGAKLAALWELLIPPADGQAITQGKYQRLVIIPDGALSLLPFETLVVENSAEPKYLLDAGPPILYAPSATVLYNLIDRRSGAAGESGESVLTVGDPVYPADAKMASAPTATSGARYRSAGGALQRLPYSGTESRWVARNFEQQGLEVIGLIGPQATEHNVRDAVANRRILHLACHGLTDQSHGNFFGALALTPGKPAAGAAMGTSSDDGYLSLPEIYGLDLHRCELAILSACQTNYGPQQKGEGVWALSRGFLVAGSRRVVASNWLVDDEAAASLVSYFTAGIAQAEKQKAELDYAQALHAAKRWVRGQAKWRSPYYWGTFVLVGPK